MNKSPAFQWYPKDILSSARVQMMTLAEEGAYRRLIDYCWINGQIPADASRAARLIGKGCSVEIAQAVLEMFDAHPIDQDKLIHDRLETEREKQLSNSEARRKASEVRWNKQGASVENGKSGKPADARGKHDEANNTNGKQVKSKSDANAMQMDMQNDPLHSSSASSTTTTNTDTNTNAGAWEFPIKELFDAFPYLESELTPGQIGLVQSDVKMTDKAAWLATIKIYEANRNPAKNQYLPEKIGNMLEVFQGQKVKHDKQKKVETLETGGDTQNVNKTKFGSNQRRDGKTGFDAVHRTGGKRDSETVRSQLRARKPA